MKKKLIIGILLIIIIICGIFIVHKIQNKYTISKNLGILFIDNSSDCKSTEEYINEILSKIKSKNKDFNIQIKSIDNIQNKILLEKYNKKFNITKDKNIYPILFIDKNYFIGYESIRKNLYSFIKYRLK